MGAGAFIMAEVLGLPYTEIALAGIIPALLFYFAVYYPLRPARAQAPAGRPAAQRAAALGDLASGPTCSRRWLMLITA
jgi:TRAP-type uncharacterized transport system fused permease subunit